MNSPSKLAIVLPAYNAAQDLEHALAKVAQGLRPYAGVVASRVYVLNDGSTDETASIAAHLAERTDMDARLRGPITILTNEGNQGLVATLKQGYARAVADGADAVLKTDTDRDFDQSVVLARFLPFVASGAQPDVVAGVRWRPIEEHENPYEFFRRQAVVNTLSTELGLDGLDPPSCGSQLYRGEALATLLKHPAVVGHTARWGLDFLMPLVARSEGMSTKIVNIENGSYDPARRAEDKVRSQYDTYEQIISRFTAK